MNSHHKFYILMPLLLLSVHTSANNFGGSISAMTGQSDNAFKSPTAEIDERQEKYGLSLTGDYTNSLLQAEADYQASDLRFSKDSQENERYLEGSSSILFGKAYQPADLRISHSRKTLLNAPDKKNLTNNQDEREVISATPTLRANLNSNDHVFAAGDFTQVKYMQNDIMDSTRKGITLGGRHGLSKIEYLQVLVQETNVEFDKFADANYTYRNAMFIYSAELRNIFYKAEMGYNESEPDVGESYSSPAYTFTLGYLSGLHEITLVSSQTITDTSLGGANANSANDLPTSDGSGNGLVDQMERLNTEITWTTSVVCNQCNFFISLYQRDDDYLRLQQQAKIQGGAFGFNYKFSKAANLSLHFSKNKQNFADQQLGRNYELAVAVAEYRYIFVNQIGLKLLAQHEKRDDDVPGREYKELYVGTGIDYSF